jgi:signal transduction histidine kinase
LILQIVTLDDKIPTVCRSEPFTRLDASRNRKSGGYGLGLAIVMRILKWHNGRVTIGDSPLGGARLTISWPGFSPF